MEWREEGATRCLDALTQQPSLPLLLMGASISFLAIPLGQFRPKSAGLTFMRHIPRRCLSRVGQNSGSAASEGQKSDPPLTISDSPSPSCLPCPSASFSTAMMTKAERDKTTQWMTHMSAARLVARHTACQGGRQLLREEGRGDDGSLTLT